MLSRRRAGYNRVMDTADRHPGWAMIRGILVLPFNACVTLPAFLLWLSGWPPVVASVASLPFLLGAILLTSGLILFVWTVTLFVRIGRGSLAPWEPTTTPN